MVQVNSEHGSHTRLRVSNLYLQKIVFNNNITIKTRDIKKAIITLLLLGFIIHVKSQYNTQLIDSTKTWSIADQP